MSRLVGNEDGPRHPYTRELRRPFVTEKQKHQLETRKHLREDRQKIKKYEKKISKKILFTIGGVSAALGVLGHKLKYVLSDEHPQCPAPKKFAVAKPPPPPAYPPVVPPTCGITKDDELKELREATKSVERLRDMLEEAEKEIKDVSNYKRSTFVDKVKQATKDS